MSVGSKSCRTMPKGNSRSTSVARERSTRIPLSAATVRAAASSEVFPIPAGPSTTTNVPLPERAWFNADSIRASSPLRSSSGPVTAAHLMGKSLPRFEKEASAKIQGISTVRTTGERYSSWRHV